MVFVEKYSEEFCGTRGLNMTAVRRKRIPLFRNSETKSELGKGFSFNVGDAKCPCVSRRRKPHGRSVHSEKVIEVVRG